MFKKLFLVLFALSFFNSFLSAQTTKFRVGVQLCPELYGYSSTQYNSTKSDYETRFRATTNFGIAANGYYSLTDRIWINLGICYFKRSFSTLEGFNQSLHLPEGAFSTSNYIMTNRQDYYLLEYPFGFTIYLSPQGKKLEPKIIGNIIGKQLIEIKCNFKSSDSFTERQNQFYGTASNLGFGIDYHLSDRMIFDFNCLYRFYDLIREQPILYGDNEKYIKNNKGILNFAFGLQINIISHKP